MREHGRVDSRVQLQDQGESRPAAVFFFPFFLSPLFKNISRVTNKMNHEPKVFFLVLLAFVFHKSDFGLAIGQSGIGCPG